MATGKTLAMAPGGGGKRGGKLLPGIRDTRERRSSRLNWDDLLANLIQYFDGRDPRFLVAISSLVLVIMGFLDYWTGTEIAFSIFYIFPIAVVAWGARLPVAVAFSIIAAFIWVAADILGPVHWSQQYIAFWNGIVRMGFFLITTLLIGAVKRLLRRQYLMARTDSLTGLMNSRRFFEEGESVLASAREGQRGLAVGFVDLDNFKLVNDRWGHATGDRLLKGIGAILLREAGRRGLIARMGGDEFGFILPGEDRLRSMEFGRRLNRAVTALGRANRWPISCSVGIVVSAHGEYMLDEMVRKADTLMYRVKRSGKNGVQCIGC